MGKNAEARALAEKQSKIESTWVYEGKYLRVRKDVIGNKTWEVGVLPGAAAIVPVDAEGRVVLVEQWRRAVGKVTLEIPAGMLDPGETPLECAQRELQEETGYKAGVMESMGGCYTSPGMLSEYIHLFLATDLIENRLFADDTDGIDVRVVPVDLAMQMIEDGNITDAKTIVGLLRYKNR